MSNVTVGSTVNLDELHHHLVAEAQEALDNYIPGRMKFFWRDILTHFIGRNDPDDLSIPGVEHQIRFCIRGIDFVIEKINSETDFEALASEYAELRDRAIEARDNFIPVINPAWTDQVLEFFVESGDSFDLLTPFVREQVRIAIGTIMRKAEEDRTAEARSINPSSTAARQRFQLARKQSRSAAAYRKGPGKGN